MTKEWENQAEKKKHSRSSQKLTDIRSDVGEENGRIISKEGIALNGDEA
jgi:hypothetical protein